MGYGILSFNKYMSKSIIGKYGLKFRYSTKKYLTDALETVWKIAT